MKIKTSYLIYAVIGTVFAGLSMFTDIFTMAKSFIDLVIKELKN